MGFSSYLALSGSSEELSETINLWVLKLIFRILLFYVLIIT